MTVAAKTLGEALTAAQAKMPAVEPDKTAEVPTRAGGKFSYQYVSLGRLISKTRPVLNEHGLAIVQSTAILETGQPVLRTVIVHVSGETLDAGETPLFSEKSMQQLGGAITYARRYAWAAALGISDQDDDDAANVDTPEPAAAKQTPPAKQPAAGVITNPQRKRLWAVAKENTVPEELLRQIVLEVAGVESTMQIPRDKYDAVIEAVQAQAVPF